jgi:hypothetical protein
MNYVVFHKEFPHQDRRYFKTLAGAKRSATCSNRNAGRQVYEAIEETFFLIKYPVGQKVVKNLMTGQDILIAEDTPYACDPSQERFWSM